MLCILLPRKQMAPCEMPLSIFDRVVSFSGKNLTREAVTENLNVLDYETYFTSTDLILRKQNT